MSDRKMNSKPSKTQKILYLLSVIGIFLMGFVAASAYNIGSLISYAAMVGAIVVALGISWGMLKILFHYQNDDKLKFDELAADEEEIKKAH